MIVVDEDASDDRARADEREELLSHVTRADALDVRADAQRDTVSANE